MSTKADETIGIVLTSRAQKTHIGCRVEGRVRFRILPLPYVVAYLPLLYHLAVANLS
jgi:hypothetical protein